MNYNKLSQIVDAEDTNYCVIRTGGSIGEHANFRYKSNRCSLVEENLTQEAAKERAKGLNKVLTPGEKSYYQIKYRAVPRSSVVQM